MIPAYNEADSISKVLSEIPRSIRGIDEIQVLVINDGSTDGTEAIARKAGTVVLSHKQNQGLAKTFKDGLDYALLLLRADIIVNTDADFQYNQKQIPLLVQPILDGKADVVLGSRFLGNIEFMPFQNKIGNRLASWAVSLVAGIPMSDGQTGFRAFSKEAALRLTVLSQYTYTQETILQAANARLRILEIPVDFRKRSGKSRLISSLYGYARQSSVVLVMGYLNYKPLRVFLGTGGIIFLTGFLGGLYILNYFFNTGQVSPHIPLAIVSVAMMLFGSQIMFLGLVAEMIKNNRKIEEEMLYLQKKNRLEL